MNEHLQNKDGDLNVSHKDTRSHIPVLQQLLIAIGALVLVFGTTYIDEISNTLSAEKKRDAMPATVETIREPEAQIDVQNPFENTVITAKAAYVWDTQAQRALFNKSADEQLPIASITKLMTALVAYELLGNDGAVPITVDAIRQDGDSGFNDGEVFGFQALTDLTLLTSSNDGAYALAAAAGGSIEGVSDPTDTFVRAMNIRAEEIGLSQTYFKNPTGLDISENESGAQSSARDVAFLMEYLIAEYPELLELTRAYTAQISNGVGEQHLAENTNPAVSKIPSIIASKTGYTELAGGNLVIAFDAGFNHPIIISVLGSTIDGRFEDVLTLAKKAQEYILTQQ